MVAPSGTVPTQATIELDPASAAILAQQLTIAFQHAFAAATVTIAPAATQMAQNTAKGILTLVPAAQKVAKAVGGIGTAAVGSFTAAEKHIIALTNSMLANQHATGVVIRELANLSIAERRRGINAGQAATDAARLQIAQVRNVGIQTNIEGQKAVVVARGAAKSRVLITQGMVRSIVLLEKGIGATITGVAKTSVAAISKIFSGVTGLFRSGTSGIDAEMRRTNAAIARGVKQGNTEFTTGVRGSLSKREELMRSSFRTQEAIISKSALRQKETLAGLRTGTQTGVLGAANRSLNLGALVGGAAIFQGVRSTFTIGSEFTRGLAVLKAQLNLTGDEMKTVRQTAIDLGNDITLPGVSALDAAEGIQLLAKQFASLGAGAVVAAEQASKGTLQLSRAAKVSAEDAAGIVGSAVNVFGVGADKATEVADQVTAALKNAAGVSFGDFSDAFKQAGSVFAQFQKPAVGATESLLEFNTAIAIMARNGLVGSDAGTSLKQLFLQANRAAPATRDALIDLAKRAGETGTAFYDANGAARPFPKTLDIIRRGLVGMTDEQRNSTLQTVFGSDAVRAANALLGTSTEEYAKVSDALREQGLASKIAAAQNTGLKGALDALKSVMETVQILLFEKVNPALGKFVLAMAAGINTVLFGKGAWATLRTGLLGVAAGLGAVLAVKGVVEIFQQLGRVVALVATPFGAFLLTAALVGGAVALLLKHSEAFREGLGHLKDNLVGFASVAKERVVTALHNIRDVIIRDVIPFLKELGKWVGEHLVDAFHAVVGFITDKVIPALETAGRFIGRIASVGFRAVVDFIRDHAIPAFQDFVRFVTSTVIPIAIRVGGVLADAFDTALDAVKRFWHWVEPVLKPMLEGFQQLAGAIAAIFTGGDFSQIGSGFAAVGSGIATSFTGIGKNLLGVLDRMWETVKAWFQRNFSGPNLISFGKGFLDLVEWIGHTLGAIVTNPAFVRAVALLAAGLAAAAVLVAGRFIEGFGKALLDNLPDLFKMVGKAILDGLVALFRNPLIAIGIGLAIAAILRVVNIVKAFRAAGTAAGGGFVGGLKGAFKRGTFGAQSGLLQFQSIFDGNAFVKYAKEQGFKAGKAMVKEFGRNNALLRTANLPGLQPINPGFLITKKQSAEAIANVEKVRLKLGDVGFAALQARTNTQSFFAVFRGAKDAIGGIGAAFTVNRTAGDGFFKSLTSGFRGAIQEMKRTALLEGGSIGKTLKQGIAAAAGTALAVGGTFIAGKAEGSSGGSGLTSAILGGLTATALTAELGPVSLVIGGATAAAGLLGAAFGRAGKAAADMKARIKELASALEDDLRQAIKDGIITLDSIKEHKIDIGDLISVSDKARQDTIDSLRAGLSLDEKDLLINIGVDLEGAADLLAQFDKNGGSLDDFRNAWNDMFLDAAGATEEFKNKVGVFGPEIVGVLKAIARPDGDKDLNDFFNTQAFQDLSQTSKDILVDNQAFFDKFLTTASKVTGKSLDDIAKSFHIATSDILVTGQKAATALDDIFGGNEHHDFETLDELNARAKTLGQTITNTANNGAMRKLGADAALAALEFVKLGTPVEDLNDELKKAGLPTIPDSIISDWQKQLGKVQTKAEELRGVVEGLPDKFADIAAAALNLPTDITQAQAIVDVKHDFDVIVDATSIRDDVGEIIKHDFDSPESKLAFEGLGRTVGAFIGGGIASGGIVTPEDLLIAIQPLRDAALEGVTDPETRTAIETAFGKLFEGLKAELPAGVGDLLGSQLADQIAVYTAAHPFLTTAAVQFNVDLQNRPNRQLLGGEDSPSGVSQNPLILPGTKPKTETLLDPFLLTDAELGVLKAQAAKDGALVSESFSTGFAKSFNSPVSHAAVEGAVVEITGVAVTTAGKVNLEPQGLNAIKGLAAGIHSTEAKRIVASAMREINEIIVGGVKNPLKMRSPSRVMMKLGGFITAGLAQGITDGATAVGNAAVAAAQAAVDAARAVAKNITLHFRSAVDTPNVPNVPLPDTAPIGQSITDGLAQSIQDGSGQAGAAAAAVAQAAVDAARAVVDGSPIMLRMESHPQHVGREVIAAAREGELDSDPRRVGVKAATAAALGALIEKMIGHQVVRRAFEATPLGQGARVITAAKIGLHEAHRPQSPQNLPKDLFPEFPRSGLLRQTPGFLKMEDPVAHRGRDIIAGARQGLLGDGRKIVEDALHGMQSVMRTGRLFATRARQGVEESTPFGRGAKTILDAQRGLHVAGIHVPGMQLRQTPGFLKMEDPVAHKGRDIVGGARQGVLGPGRKIIDDAFHGAFKQWWLGGSVAIAAQGGATFPKRLGEWIAAASGAGATRPKQVGEVMTQAAQRGVAIKDFPRLLGEWINSAAQLGQQRSLTQPVPNPRLSLRAEDPVAHKGRDIIKAAQEGLPQTRINVGLSVADAARIAAEFARVRAQETGASVIDRARLGTRATPEIDKGSLIASTGAVAEAARQAIAAATSVLQSKTPSAFQMEDPVARKGRDAIGDARSGAAMGVGALVLQQAKAGTQPDPELAALKTEMTNLLTVARSLVSTAEALTKRGPDVTNVAITEAKDARSTARATITELRAHRILGKKGDRW